MHSLQHALAFAALAVVPLGLIVAETATTTKNTEAKKKSTTATKRKSATATRKTTGATRKTGTTKKGPSTAASRQTWRARQLQPTPERYKEIQQALASKGYLSGEPSGTWNQESTDAMRRFQQDQNITASGKIDSLSLIALGLGPKRGPAPVPPGHPDPKPETPSQPPSNKLIPGT
jgi:Putative peptidoglycan binding domain